MKSKILHNNIIRIALLLSLSYFNAIAQDTLNGYTVEQKSLQLYQDKKWKELIKFGNAAVKNDYDYFYLEMRIGIACFERKNYCGAESHFRKALGYSSNDELAQEYLHYCYVYTGRNEDARMLSKKFSKELAAKIGTDKLSSVGFIMFEGGTKIADNTSYSLNKNNYSFNPAVYFQLGLNQYIKNRVSFFHAATYFSQNTSGDSLNLKRNSTLSQLQYYIKAGIPFKKGWLISPAFHYVNTNYSYTSSLGITQTQTDTLWPPGVPHIPPPPGFPPLKTTTTDITNTYGFNSKSQINYFIGSLAIQKIIKKFTFSIGSTLFYQSINKSTSNLYNSVQTSSVQSTSSQTQYIHFASVYYAPLGNSKLVLGCTGYAHTIDSYKTIYPSYAPFIYVQPATWLSFKLVYFSNQKNNIIEDNGYFVNNSPDLTTSRYSILANFYITKTLALYATYQLENKQNTQGLDYRYNIMVAGIKITP